MESGRENKTTIINSNFIFEAILALSLKRIYWVVPKNGFIFPVHYTEIIEKVIQYIHSPYFTNKITCLKLK